MEEEKIGKRIRMWEIFNPLLNLIYKNNLIFLCNGEIENSEDLNIQLQFSQRENVSEKLPCNSLLTTSQDICSLYYIDDKKFCLIVDVKKMKTLPIKFDKMIHKLHKDEKLNQNDCIYKIVICRDCKKEIGRLIIGTPNEKKYLRNKIILFSDCINTILIDDFETSIIDLNNYITVQPSESEEIRDYFQINQKLAQFIYDLEKNMLRIKKYSEMKLYMKSVERQFIGNIELSKYVSFLKNKKKES